MSIRSCSSAAWPWLWLRLSTTEEDSEMASASIEDLAVSDMDLEDSTEDSAVLADSVDLVDKDNYHD